MPGSRALGILGAAAAVLWLLVIITHDPEEPRPQTPMRDASAAAAPAEAPQIAPPVTGGDADPPAVGTPQPAAPPVAPPAVRVAAAAAAAPRLRYVTATLLNLRAGPATTAAVVAQLPAGTRLAVEEERRGWLRVSTAGRSGWVHGGYTSAESPAPEVARAAAPPLPVVSRSALARGIVQRSVAGYSGACPCPWNRDAAGRLCGRRSAWSRPGGAAPVCYESEVTDAMIARLR